MAHRSDRSQHFCSPLGRVPSVFLAIILALLAAGTTWAAIGWPAEEQVNVSQSGEVAHVALAVSNEGQPAAAWWVKIEERGDGGGNLILARSTGSGWTTETVTTTLQSRGPSLAYSGTALFLAWALGEQYTQPATAFGGRIWEWGEQGTRPVTETIFYGDENWFRPRLKIGQDGLHLAFAAAVTSTKESPRHLFYAYRPFGSESWSVTVAITSAQVGPGKVFFPDLAVGNGEMHLLWEQRVISSSIYYVSGTMGANGPIWATPVRLSDENKNSQQPAIAVDGTGRIHVAWTEWSSETKQKVLYRLFEGEAWTSEQFLSEEVLKVNQLRPTVVWPAIAARGERVCVAWHGFYPTDAPYTVEEIFLRCSKDGGHTWGPLFNVSRSPGQLSLFPAIAIDADGRVHLAWEEFQGGNNYFYNYDAIYVRGPSEVYPVFLPLVMRNR